MKTQNRTATVGKPIEPVVISTEGADTDEKIHIFTIDDTDYYMPAYVPASLSLQALDRMRRHGQEAALSWLLEAVLGAEAYQALMDCPTLTGPQLKAVMRIIGDHVLGQMEDVTGN